MGARLVDPVGRDLVGVQEPAQAHGAGGVRELAAEPLRRADRGLEQSRETRERYAQNATPPL